MPIRAKSLGGCALESSFRGGVKRECLRSLCQVHNGTTLRLQVALAALAHADEWQEVPQQASSHRRRSSQVLSLPHSRIMRAWWHLRLRWVHGGKALMNFMTFAMLLLMSAMQIYVGPDVVTGAALLVL